MAILIDDLDYNQIREKIVKIMGSGIGQFGYGQIVISSPIFQGDIIRKDQWDRLRFDILNARIHQEGIVPNLTEAVKGQPILTGESNPKKQYNANVDIATTKKFLVGPGQFVVEAGSSRTRTGAWKNSLETTVTVTFGTPDQARWFFNSGGRLRFSSSRFGGLNTLQNNAWSSLLANIGTISFGATALAGINSTFQTSSVLTFWQLTNSYQNFFVGTQASPYQYASNSVVIRAKSNVSNNSNGGASIIEFQVTWSDNYIYTKTGIPAPPGDQVDGTLRLSVEELRASGNLLPNGAGPFAITRPTYSISELQGS